MDVDYLINVIKLMVVDRDNYYDDDAFVNYIKELLNMEHFKKGTASYGIARHIETNGVKDLTDKQISTLVNYGLDNSVYRRECPMCLEDLSFDDILETIDEDMCSLCRYKMEKY